tara:strand:+ start:34666 stop:34770 length:105 start_codon:yes stop_codon:yes gene_type:complete
MNPPLVNATPVSWSIHTSVGCTRSGRTWASRFKP